MDFVLNSISAERVRLENERAMQDQLLNMRQTTSDYERLAQNLDEQARMQRGISITATRMEWQTRTRTEYTSRTEPVVQQTRVQVQVADTAARELAARRAAILSSQAEALRASSREITHAAGSLEHAVTYTNEKFYSLETQAREIDRRFTGQMELVIGDIQTYVRLMDSIRQSIQDMVPNSAWAGLMSRLQRQGFNRRMGVIGSPESVFFDNLQTQFGFDAKTVLIMQDVMNALKRMYPDDSQAHLDWRFMRLLAGFVYGDSNSSYIQGELDRFMWDNTAGNALMKNIYGMDAPPIDELEFFTKYLGIPESDFNLLRYRVRIQREIAGWEINDDECALFDGNRNRKKDFDSYKTYMERALGQSLSDEEFIEQWYEQFESMRKGDFAHMAIVIATCFATDLDKSGSLSLVVTGGRQEREWMAGWLGDATLSSSGGSPSFENDDYIADLDAANIMHLVRTQSLPLFDAANLYYSQVGPELTRAEMFLGHTPYELVQSEIAKRLIPPYMVQNMTPEQQMEHLRIYSNHAYRFLRSLEDPENHHNIMPRED